MPKNHLRMFFDEAKKLHKKVYTIFVDFLIHFWGTPPLYVENYIKR